MRHATTRQTSRRDFLREGVGALAIGRTLRSSPPQPSSPPPKGDLQLPNVVLILLDDIGFADASTFGGVARTPSLDRLAAQGLRYNNFHTVGLCSPTRAALLTGRNHHRVGFGCLADLPGQSTGYDTVWKKGTASIAELLRQSGYSTAAIGKWHNTPFREVTPVGPFDRWPTGLGFDYFYGFMGPGCLSQWEPSSLYRNTTPVEPGAKPQQGYHLTVDLTDEAIHWVQTVESVAPTKPYLLYFAPAAVHWPHHVPKEWIARYRGEFDQGWDRFREETFARQRRLGVIPADAELTTRPQEIPAWDSLSADQKRLYAHQMEVYAAFVEHTDHEIGRLLQAVQQGPRGSNTLILFIVGDNGGSPGPALREESVQDQLRYMDELGGPLHNNGIEAGWAWAGSTPFQWYKGTASHLGAVRNPLVISWPARIKDTGGLRNQFTHVSDIAATLCDVTGVHFPTVINGAKQHPLDGVSFAPTFDHAMAPSNHRVQYFEMSGNRAIYQDGWVAAARHSSLGASASENEDYEHDRWELYHVNGDFSEAHDLAGQYPDKLKTLQQLFASEARKNDIYPLGGAGPAYSSPLTTGEFVYHPSLPRIMGLAAPAFSKPHRISAQLIVPEGEAQGVIVSFGSRWGGFVLYANDGYVVYETNVGGQRRNVITSNIPLPQGRVNVSFQFFLEKYVPHDTSTGRGQLHINEKLVGEAKVEMDEWAATWGSLGIGQAFGSPVSQAFEVPFKFIGTVEEVRLQLT